MNLLSCARIATSKMNLIDRADRMQDAILHVLSKGIEHRSSSYIIRSMKNKIIYDLREEKRTKKTFEEAAAENLSVFDDYEVFELIGSLSPRDRLLFLWVAYCGIAFVSRTLDLGYKQVKNRFLALRMKLRKEMEI